MGCSIVEIKALPSTINAPVLYWHIDRFANGEQARAGVGPTSIAFEGHGTWWLASVESKTDDHHGGEHAGAVKLPPLPDAPSYSMLVLSAYLPGRTTSRVHFHSGVEAFYAISGEQCLETAERAIPLKPGDTFALPTGATMRFVATGEMPRRALAVIVYDSTKPPTTRKPMEMASGLVSCTK